MNHMFLNHSTLTIVNLHSTLIGCPSNTPASNNTWQWNNAQPMLEPQLSLGNRQMINVAKR